MEEKILIGRHISLNCPDYLLGALKKAISYGSNSLMIYIGSPQTYFRRPLNQLKINEFKQLLLENNLNINHVVVHGSYLVNLANTINNKKLLKSIEFLASDISRMEVIGLKTLIIHPGSSLGKDKCISLMNISNSLNKILSNNSSVQIALETMAGRTNELGSNFEEIKFIIDNVEQNEKIGVCWDTCHLYNAGYDVKGNLNKVIDEFENKIGLNKLWVIHLNDSVHDFNSRKDRHTNIGYGTIGFEALKKIAHHKDLKNAIKILETPLKQGIFEEEIKSLKKR